MNSPSITSLTTSNPAIGATTQGNKTAADLLECIAFRNRQIKELEAENEKDKEHLQSLYDADMITDKFTHPGLPIKASLRPRTTTIYSESCQDSIAKLKQFDVYEGLTTTKTTYFWTITERKTKPNA